MKTVNFQICYTTVLAVLLKQFVASDEFVIPREPTAKEIAACKVAREENLHVAPTWPKQFDLMTKMVKFLIIFILLHALNNGIQTRAAQNISKADMA